MTIVRADNRDDIAARLPRGLRTAGERLAGFGRHAYVDCLVAYPRDVDELKQLVEACSPNGFSITSKGSGCSFGDIVTNSQGVVLDLSSWNELLAFNPATGVLTAQCGTSAGRVLHRTLPHHWILRGLPGTSFATMAGLIANNVHGKDSFKHGNFGNGVISMKMLLASGDIIDLSRDEHSDIFHAVIGGMGLLGVILEATFQLIRIPGSMVETEKKYFNSIPELFDEFSKVGDVEMDMAWFDGFHRHGRGIFQTARWLSRDPDVPPPSMEHIEKKFMGKIPIDLVYPLVKPFACRPAMSALNTVAFWGSKFSGDRSRLHLYQYYYPHMTAIPDSPRAMKGGLVGFQILVADRVASEFIQKLLALCRAHKCESWFGGIKRLKKDPFLMSFAEDGYATTIELPGRFTSRPAFTTFLDRLIGMTLDYKGKMFLGKDTQLRSADVRAMYPRLQEFLDLRYRCDPHGVFGSDQSRRLEL